jgi:hypothetical protein
MMDCARSGSGKGSERRLNMLGFYRLVAVEDQKNGSEGDSYTAA